MNYGDLMDIGFAGMKADSGDDRVETHPSAGDIPFGAFVSVKDGKVVAGAAGNPIIGVAVHSHAVTGSGYVQYDPVSVMTRGLIWARAAETDDSKSYSQVTINDKGEVDSNGSYSIVHAVMRDARTVNGGRIVLVELHAPTA